MSGWIKVKERMPDDGREVTVFMRHGQVRQVVRDAKYSGGWKQVNCQGWEIVSFDPDAITHWNPEILKRPENRGPSDAPWIIS